MQKVKTQIAEPVIELLEDDESSASSAPEGDGVDVHAAISNFEEAAAEQAGAIRPKTYTVS